MNKYLLQFQWIKQNESIYKAKANMQSTHVHTHAIEKAEKERSSEKEHRVDALAPRAEEGRG